MKLTDIVREGRTAFTSSETYNKKASIWVARRVNEYDWESITALGQLFYDLEELIYTDLGEPVMVEEVDSKGLKTGQMVQKVRTGTASRRYGSLRKLVERKSDAILEHPFRLVVEKGKVLITEPKAKAEEPKAKAETGEPEIPPETPLPAEAPEVSVPEVSADWMETICKLFNEAPTRGDQRTFIQWITESGWGVC